MRGHLRNKIESPFLPFHGGYSNWEFQEIEQSTYTCIYIEELL